MTAAHTPRVEVFKHGERSALPWRGNVLIDGDLIFHTFAATRESARQSCATYLRLRKQRERQ